MKKLFFLMLLVQLNIGCTSYRKIFESGNVTMKRDVEEIKIHMVNNLPLCKVIIRGKEYTFLLDTGAPTVISENIFQELQLKASAEMITTDSQKNKQKKKFTKLPEIQIGDLVFNDIGCAVMNIDNSQIKCFGFEGIVGANLMSKLFLEFDYKNNLIKAANQLSLFSIEQSDFTFDFKPKIQKTPVVKGKVLDKELSFTFDTGANGYLQIQNDYTYYKNKSTNENFITNHGISSIGVYGSSKSDTTFIMKNSVDIDSILFNNEIITSGNSTLIGNKFLKDYIFLIDWRGNKIYLKKNEVREEKEIKTFGFSYLFTDGKPIITSKTENRNIPVNLGDEIISIDEVVFAEINSEETCKYYLNKVEENRQEIDITVKRGNEILFYHLVKQEFIK